MMTKTEQARQLYRHNFNSFYYEAQYLINHVEIAPHWSTDLVASSMQSLSKSSKRSLVINMPLGYGISFMASVAYATWFMARNPQVRILCIGKSAHWARRQSEDAIELMQSKRYRQIFPHMNWNFSKSTIRTIQGGELIYRTINEPITVEDIDLVILDTPVNAKYMEDDRRMQVVNQYWDTQILPCLKSLGDSRIILATPRLHKKDLSTHVLAQDKAKHVCCPAIATEDFRYPKLFSDKLLRKRYEALNPLVHTRKALYHLMNSVKARVFMAMYQQRPYKKRIGVRRWVDVSGYRKDIPWKVGEPIPSPFCGWIPEEAFLINEVFGNGKHPDPGDNRVHVYPWEKTLMYGTNIDRSELIQIMTPEERESYGIDPSGKVFPDFRQYLSEKQQSIPENMNYDPNYIAELSEEEKVSLKEMYTGLLLDSIDEDDFIDRNKFLYHNST